MPLLQFSYHGDMCNFQYKEEQLTANYSFFLACSYFNTQLGRWEPFLEKSPFAIYHQGYPFTHGGPFNVSIGSQFKNGAVKSGEALSLVELVVTDEMIRLVVENKEYFENLIQAVTTGVSTRKLNNFEERGELNRYVYQLRVDNFSGYEVDLEFQGGMICEEENFLLVNEPDLITGTVQNCRLFNQNQAIVCEIPYMLAFCLQERANSSQSEGSLLMTMRIADRSQSLFVAKDVEVEEKSAKRCILDHNEKKKPPKEVFVSVSYQDNCKLVVLQSRVMIRNQIDRKIWISIVYESVDYTYEVEPGECMGIPEELLGGHIKIKLNLSAAQWPFYSKLKKLLDSQPGIVGYIQNDNKQEFFLVRLVPDKRIPSKLTLQIDHQLNITNCLPVPLKIGFRVSSAGYPERRDEKVLSPKETLTFNKFDPKQIVFVNFMLRGYDWTDLIPLKSFNGVNAISNLVFKDGAGSQLTVNIKYNSEHKFPMFYVYCDYCVVDQTGFDLMLMKKGESKAPIPGYLDLFDSKLPDLKVYILNQLIIRDLVLARSKFPEFTTEVLPIGLVGDYRTRIEIKNAGKQKPSDLIDLSIETRSLRLRNTTYISHCSYSNIMSR